MEAKTLNKSKELLLSAAKELFWKYGIRRVKVSEICKEADVSKMTFYRNFKNKNDLAEQLIEGIMQQAMKDYDTVMHSDKPFPEKVREIVQLKHRWAKGISKEFVMDMLNMEDKSIAMKMDAYRQNQMKVLIQDFAEAQKQGWIRQEVNLDFLMYILNDLNAKAMDPNLHQMYENEEELIMELTNYFFYGVLSPIPSES